jgi:hypothetical protein
MLTYVILISLQPFMAYLFIKTARPEKEEGEPESETVGDDTPIENQRQVHMHLLPLILDQ